MRRLKLLRWSRGSRPYSPSPSLAPRPLHPSPLPASPSSSTASSLAKRWLSSAMKILAGVTCAGSTVAAFTSLPMARAEKVDVLAAVEKSEAKYSHPEEPCLVRAVADTLDDVCLSDSEDVLLFSYIDTCHSCGQLKPVIKQLAKVFETEENITVAVMDGDKNYKKDFFSRDIEETYPILVLYKANKTRSNPKRYPNCVKYPHKHAKASELIQFIHDNGTVAFNVDTALSRARELQGETRQELKVYFEKQLKEEVMLQLFARGPCPDNFKNLTLLKSFKTYTEFSAEDEAAQEKLMRERDVCLLKDSTYKYWSRINEFAQQQLEDD